MEHGTSLVLEKVVAALIIVSLSLTFGFLPLLISRRYSLHPGVSTEAALLGRRSLPPSLLSFLLNLGGGVLLANCFCHWLPEVRDGLTDSNIYSVLPLAEVMMCSGFLAVMAVEVSLHHCLDRDRKEESEGREEAQSLVRTVFVLLALSFHSVVEGLALALERESAGVWLNTGATSLHKFVIAFSLGVELVASEVRQARYNISISIFSLAPALGCLIGLSVEKLAVSPEGLQVLPLQLLQGLATGTIVYIIFFEIFPKAQKTGGSGIQHTVAITLGFALFLPSLYFHSGHDEGSSALCGNSSDSH